MTIEKITEYVADNYEQLMEEHLFSKSRQSDTPALPINEHTEEMFYVWGEMWWEDFTLAIANTLGIGITAEELDEYIEAVVDVYAYLEPDERDDDDDIIVSSEFAERVSRKFIELFFGGGK